MCLQFRDNKKSTFKFYYHLSPWVKDSSQTISTDLDNHVITRENSKISIFLKTPENQSLFSEVYLIDSQQILEFSFHNFKNISLELRPNKKVKKFKVITSYLKDSKVIKDE